MIVRDESHIIAETLDAVAPYISSWVIVDTGSEDGTQDLIRDHMARLGIPGELHERPWRNFGHNRSEALALARGHGDYIWVLDADDTLTGTPDFDGLSADLYELRIKDACEICWRANLFRDGLGFQYVGVVHEYVDCDDPYSVARLEGDYHIESRRLGARNLNPQKYARDRDLLLAEVERNPEDSRAVFYLAQSFYDLGDFASARKWYARRVDLGGWEEEVYFAKWRIADSMWRLREPWPEVQDAFLRAWEFRPTRAEPLYGIAFPYRLDDRHWLGYLFAKCAGEIPLPEDDTLFVGEDIYTWQANDEQAVCAHWIGKHQEELTLNRRILARSDLPDDDRQRIIENRNACAPTLIEESAAYPAALARSLVAGRRDAEVVVSIIAGRDPTHLQQTLNSFLNCCTDASRVGRFLVVASGLSAQDRATLLERYGFLDFCRAGHEDATGAQLARLRDQIEGRFWLHLNAGWRFFAHDSLITRLRAVFDAETQVFQVGINVADAVQLTDAQPADPAVRRTPDGARYVLTEAMANGPAMFDTARLDRAGGIRGTDRDPVAELGRRAAAAGLRTATLDEVLCVGRIPTEVVTPSP